jgi:hypothetical protein
VQLFSSLVELNSHHQLPIPLGATALNSDSQTKSTEPAFSCKFAAGSCLLARLLHEAARLTENVIEERERH